MSTRHLRHFFEPKSIAVIGASEQADSFGGVVLRNLQRGGYQGWLCAVNRHAYRTVYGVPCYRKVTRLPQIPDLAILCTPPTTIPRLVRLLGKIGVRAALVMMGGMGVTISRSGRPLPGINPGGCPALRDPSARSQFRGDPGAGL